MAKLQKLAFCVDFQDDSDCAKTHALQIAQDNAAQLHALHVNVLHESHFAWADIPNTASIEVALGEAEDRRMTKLLKSLPSGAIRGQERSIVAAPGILDYCNAHAIDLIVMGTHSRRGVARWFMGSVTADVLRQAARSVLVVPSQAVLRGHGFKHILVAVDFSDASTQALQQAREFAKRYQAELVLVHIVDTQTLPPYFQDSFVREAERLARRRMDDFVEEHGLQGQCETQVEVGLPEQKLAEVAHYRSVDLVIMGATGLSGMEQFFLGSTTDRLLRRIDRPVWVQRGAVLEFSASKESVEAAA